MATQQPVSEKLIRFIAATTTHSINILHLRAENAAASFAYIIRVDGYFGDLYNNIVDGRSVGGWLWPSHLFIRRSIGRRSGVRRNCVWAGEESARRPYVGAAGPIFDRLALHVNESPADRLLTGM